MPGISYSDGDGTALAGLLDGQGVRLSEVAAPVSTADGDDAELGDDDGGADGGSDFLGGLDAETDMTLAVADNDDGLEAGSLTGTGLLLDGLDLCVQGKQAVSHCPPTIVPCRPNSARVRISRVIPPIVSVQFVGFAQNLVAGCSVIRIAWYVPS